MPEYIEREAVVARIKQTFCSDCDSYNGVRCRACLIDDALLQIEDEPAADVAPVVHGEWMWNDDEQGYNCPHCPTTYWKSPDVPSAFKYCPLCGAKMDGGKK